ncbi:hypothetical protein PAT3040_02372 [Paenibacillus agaridevorans]|uniref:SLH domain-containing protein n=1 Tax=Paenibacillus agaridevorans TaxID=171404 RepID=A0A2R5EWN6_9BACL|nr:S-layer homology domain-containing protein [Paenibacillus agaridevorans]GBG07811.1 hypothetical protein PAT3040_02372 [Paenibacillus agaridevorans]
MKVGKQIMLIILSLLLVVPALPVLTAAAAEEQRAPAIIAGDFTNIDFNVSVPTAINNVYTLDSKLLGTVSATPGSNSAGSTDDSDGSNVFYMEANSTAINSFKSGINKTDRFGIQTRVKFNNTDSRRAFFEIRSMTPQEGSPAWPTLVDFDQTGRIKDYKGNVLGTYAADQWYDIVVDIDSPNHRYSVWINGELMVNHLDLGNFIGVSQNKIIQHPNAAQTPSRVTIAYLRAGMILDSVPLSGLSIQSLNGGFYVNQTAQLTLVKTPSDSTEQSFNWASGNADIVKVDNQGVITGLRSGTAQITVSSLQNPTITASMNITVETMPAPVFLNPTYLNADYNDYNLHVNNNIVTVDSVFVGYIATEAGSNRAGLMSESGDHVLLLEAVSSSLNTFKSAINKTDRFGIQTRMKFNNTDSRRALFEMKGMTPPSGSPAWPTLLNFDQTGHVKDYLGNVLGTYEADQWYDIIVDVDSPNHRYSVWINGELTVNNLDLGNFIGVTQNKIIQNTNASQTASRTSIAYMKVGDIVEPLQDLELPDIIVDKGKAAILTYKTVPEKAYIEKVTWTSSNPAVAKMSGNGLLALNTGTATITATESYSGITKSFEVTVQEPATNWSSQAISSEDLAAVLATSYRSELNYGFDQIMTDELQAYLEMDESDFIREIQKASSSITFPDQHTKFESYARLFAQLHKLTNDQQYARKAAIILYYQALDYPRIVVNTDYTNFWGGNYQFPQDAVYAYGSLISSDLWGSLLPDVTGSEVKQVIEELWLRPASYENIRLMNSMRLNNISPYGGRSSVVAGMLLNDPGLIREVIDIYDRLLMEDNYLFDGMWYEQTSSYSDQVYGNVMTTVNVLKNWTDPEGYTDNKLGLHLDKTDLSSRWPLLNITSNFSSDKLIYPDGTSIPINDGYGKSGDSQPLPVIEKGLKNIELPGLGYCGLFQGDTNEATHAGLLNQPTDLGFAGGHTHTNFLSLDLWGAGVEMLPYTGYVNRTSYGDGSGSTVRYPSMRPYWRNMAWVWREDGANTVSEDDRTQAALLAYDSGDTNNKKIQLVEGSNPGPEGRGADLNRRLIMMINLDGNRNYTFDLTRMQGGQAHEIYQRGAELENMDVQLQGIELADTGAANLQNYLVSIDSTAGLSQDRNQLLNPKAGSGDSSFSMTWTGEQTGASIRTFMNGISSSDVFLSSIPTARRIETKADESKYVTPHIVRRNMVTDSTQITQYGAVHEIFRQGQTGEISEVEWFRPDDADPMTNFAVVKSGKYQDIIYTSGDTEERSLHGITFAGNIAFARMESTTGKLLFSYVYGAGKVAAQDHVLINNDSQQLEIIAATTASLNTGLDSEARGNTITVKGKFSNPEALVGQWVQMIFADGSGYGMKVKNMTELGDSTVVEVEQFNPFRVTDRGVETIFFPQVSIPGKAYVLANLSDFAIYSDPPVTTDPGDTGSGTGSSITPPTSVVLGSTISITGQITQAGGMVGAINEKDLQAAIENADKQTITIKLNGTADVKSAQLRFPLGPIQALKKGTIHNLVIDMGFVTVTLKADVLTNGSSSQSEAELIVANTDGSKLLPKDAIVYDFSLYMDGKPVNQFRDHVVQVEIPYPIKADENPNKIVIYYVTDDEKLEIIKSGKYNPQTGKVSFYAKHFSKYAVAYRDISFADLSSAAWAIDAIEGLAAREVVNGTGNHLFLPHSEVTRAEFTAMLIRAFDLEDENATTSFTDVAKDSWSYKAIASAQKLGIIEGMGDGSFGAERHISRQDMAVILYRAAAKLNVQLVSPQQVQDFADAANISDYAKEAVEAMKTAGLMNGFSEHTFKPVSFTTRAQAATVIYQLLQVI